MKISRLSIGLAISSARMAANLTAAGLARRAGISTSSISRTEAGKRDLEFREALGISKALGIDVSVLQDLAETFESRGAGATGVQISELEAELLKLQREAITTAVALRSECPS